MDSESVLYVKSIGLEYALRNHLKGDKEIAVKSINQLAAVTITVMF